MSGAKSSAGRSCFANENATRARRWESRTSLNPARWYCFSGLSTADVRRTRGTVVQGDAGWRNGPPLNQSAFGLAWLGERWPVPYSNRRSEISKPREHSRLMTNVAVPRALDTRIFSPLNTVLDASRCVVIRALSRGFCAR